MNKENKITQYTVSGTYVSKGNYVNYAKAILKTRGLRLKEHVRATVYLNGKIVLTNDRYQYSKVLYVGFEEAMRDMKATNRRLYVDFVDKVPKFRRVTKNKLEYQNIILDDMLPHINIIFDKHNIILKQNVTIHMNKKGCITLHKRGVQKTLFVDFQTAVKGITHLLESCYEGWIELEVEYKIPEPIKTLTLPKRTWGGE